MRKAIVGLMVLAGCAGDAAGPSNTQQSLVVHEWGTYTSLQTSQGKVMAGLQHSEEALPAFVFERFPDPREKGIERIAGPVTQKLETPVLYFYPSSPTAVPKVDIKVDFPQGIISEAYPAAKTYAPEIGQLTAMAGGSMSWSVALTDKEAVHPPAVPADSIWAPSRRVAAAGVRAGSQDEDFIFYRGLGAFEVPFHVTTLASGDLQVANDSDQAIPAAFMLWVHSGGGEVVPIGEVPAHGVRVVSPTPKERDMTLYLADAKTKIAASLVASGLYADEAQAMVDTWSKSYFETFGLRVLYVAPRAWTDKLLPISISPTPTDLVRTLVGRVEVMTAAEEQSVVAQVSYAQAQGKPIPPDTFGRFTEAKLRRAAELVSDPTLHAYAMQQIDLAAAQP
jgi:hypothetical protein